MKRKINGTYLFLFTLFVALFACAFYWGKERHETAAVLTHIAQTGPRKEALHTDYLTARLELDSKTPIFLSSFDFERAKKKLLNDPLIEEVDVTKEKGGTILIDYTIRYPYALLGDFSNCALDAKGNVFPFTPFFSPKRMTKLYFGLPSLKSWPQNPLKIEEIDFAFTFFAFLKKTFPSRFPFIDCIDVSKVGETSLGKREVVVTLKRRGGDTHYLRFTPKRYREELHRYCLIQNRWEGNLTFDFRLKELAFVEKWEDLSL